MIITSFCFKDGQEVPIAVPPTEQMSLDEKSIAEEIVE